VIRGGSEKGRWLASLGMALVRETSGFFWGGDGFEAVGFVAGDDGSVACAHHGETLRDAHAGAAPPISADCATGNVLSSFQSDGFVDVEVSLEDGDDVVSVEEGKDLERVADGERAVFTRCRGLTPRRVSGDKRYVDRDDDRRGGAGVLEVVFQPGELCGIDARVPEAIVGGLDGVEDDEVPAFVVEGVVGLAEAIFVHFFAVAGIGGRGAAGGVDAEDVVIADDLMERHLERGLRFLVEVEDGVGAVAVDGDGVEDVVAAHDGEVGIERGDFFVAEFAAVGGVEFGLDVGVGEEDEVEMGGCGGVGGPGGLGRDGCGGGGEGGGFQEVAAG
jgi:hypothetical protein